MNDEQFEQFMQIASAQYIQLCRIYDFLTVISDKLGIDAIAIKDMHVEGKTFSPYPALIDESEDNEEI
jgi:hypothetical protein